MTTLAIPEPGAVLPAGFAEQARVQLAEWDDVAIVDEARRRLAALESYVSSRDAKHEAAAAARWAEVRIGELLGEPTVGAHSSAVEGGNLTADERLWFRRLAANRDLVAEHLTANNSGRVTSRNGLLRAIQAARNTTPPVFPDGTYGAIAADPPWHYGNQSTRGAATDHYSTLSIEQLTGRTPLPDDRNLAELVNGHAADTGHLYLWTTNGFLREAFDVMDAWGYEYKTTLTWVKPQIGLGNYFRNSTEHVLFGVRGGLRTTDEGRTQRTDFTANRTRHSAKPDAFYDIVERCSPGPYLEMFSRTRRLNWSNWGDEA